MKHNLECCRELILMLSSILKWDKSFYAGIVFGVISFAYLVLWYLNLSTLTLVSILGLFAVIFDYGFPIVSKFVFKSTTWTGVQEKAFEDVCAELLAIKLKLRGFVKYLFGSKEDKTIMVSSVLRRLKGFLNLNRIFACYSTTPQQVWAWPSPLTSDQL